MLHTFLEWHRQAQFSHGLPRELHGFPGPPRAPQGPQKPKMFSFGATITCLTLFPIKISPEIQWVYTYTYTWAPHSPPEPPRAPPRAPGGLKTKYVQSWPTIKCHSIFPIFPENQWADTHTYSRAPQGTQGVKSINSEIQFFHK